jgi:hypothetical protein
MKMKSGKRGTMSVRNKRSRDQPHIRSRAAAPILFAMHGFSRFTRLIHDRLIEADSQIFLLI